ncbi:ferredoxin-type protein NapG, partial [Campylobacter upsaliensis]|nr:ferredoxin-type protein NapG [Campylobacter upsaliensis]
LPRAYVLGKAGAHYVKGWDKQDEDKLKNSSTQRKLDNERAKDYLNAEDLL